MRRWMAAPLVLFTAVWLTSLEPPTATAQPPAPVAETLRTADGMELHGLFHATATNPTTAPVVVFLYAPGNGQDMTKGDWGGLTKRLTDKGYHVFQFDWRGHGKSTTIKDTAKFWKNQYLNAPGPNFNGYIKGGAVQPPKATLAYKDLIQPARYLPAYMNDLAAVRLYLDTKNDARELNASSIYVVGTGDAAALGMAWLTAEWNRPAVKPDVQLLGLGATGYEFVPQPLRGTFDEGGADFGGAVWLTATRPTAILAQRMQYWVTARPPNATQAAATKMRENNPMLFLYADKDVAGNLSGKRQGEFFFNEVLVADPAKAKAATLVETKQTFLRSVPDAGKLQGIQLLGQNATLKTEDTIMQYLDSLQKVREKITWKSRKYDSPYYIDVRYFGLTP